MTKRKSDFTLPTLDDLFTTQAERDDAKLERVKNIPLDELHPFKNHPFKILNNEDMERMIESIQIQDHLGTGDGDRACPAGGRRLQQPLGVDRCRGELLIFSPENRRSCRLILWAKIKKPVIGVITGFLWRRVRDSNPRDLSVYSISSQVVKTELGGI